MPLSAKKITLSPEVLCQELGGEMVLLDLRSESYFGLDATGARIWQLLQEQNGDLQAVFDCMLQEFDVGAEQLHSDLDRLLTELAAAGLIALHTDARHERTS